MIRQSVYCRIKLCQNFAKIFFFYYSLPCICARHRIPPSFQGWCLLLCKRISENTHSLTITGKFQLLTLLEEATRNTSHCSAVHPSGYDPVFPSVLSSGYVSFYFFVNILFTSSAFFSLCFRIAIVSCVLCFTSLTFLRGLIFHSSLQLLTGFFTRNKTLFLFYFGFFLFSSVWKDIFRGRRAHYVYISLRKRLLIVVRTLHSFTSFRTSASAAENTRWRISITTWANNGAGLAPESPTNCSRTGGMEGNCAQTR